VDDRPQELTPRLPVPPVGENDGEMNATKTSTSTLLTAIGGAFVLGRVLAKCIDWIGHAHPHQ
jgi:hypothetical protein